MSDMNRRGFLGVLAAALPLGILAPRLAPAAAKVPPAVTFPRFIPKVFVPPQDAQRLYNQHLSAYMERIALEPRVEWMAYSTPEATHFETRRRSDAEFFESQKDWRP